MVVVRGKRRGCGHAGAAISDRDARRAVVDAGANLRDSTESGSGFSNARCSQKKRMPIS